MNLINEATFQLRSLFHVFARPENSISLRTPLAEAVCTSPVHAPIVMSNIISLNPTGITKATRITSADVDNAALFHGNATLQRDTQRVMTSTYYDMRGKPYTVPEATVVLYKDRGAFYCVLVSETPEQIKALADACKAEQTAYERKRPTRGETFKPRHP